MQTPNVLAAVARVFPLPNDAQGRVKSFLELYEGLPDTSPVWQELVDAAIEEEELCVQTLSDTTRIVLSWECHATDRRRGDQEVRMIDVDILWQERSINTFTETGFETKFILAFHQAKNTPVGTRAALQWAKEQWKLACLGPCPECHFVEGERPQKRMRLACSQMCARCTMKRIIQ
jgi:hypothetical protein